SNHFLHRTVLESICECQPDFAQKGMDLNSWLNLRSYLRMQIAEKYCEIHDLTDEQYVELLDRMPSTEVFTGYLLNALLMRGHRATKAEILSKLGAEKNEEDIANGKGKSGQNRVRCPEYRWAQ
ncbi:hypothetical protein, partial [Citrobacter freundii]|uniref:hypothetical protein n=1 Tax=Citrobacter freundii TaxID=546 RepID=UPI00406A1865